MENSKPLQPEEKKIGHSKLFISLVTVLAGLIILIGVFALGINVGFHKTRFSDDWVKNYPKNFAVPPGGFYPVALPPQNSLFGSHGLAGSILTVSGNTLTIKSSDNSEKTVIVSPTTAIREDFADVKAAQLAVNQQVVVIGEPNAQGQIEAKFIRVMDKQ